MGGGSGGLYNTTAFRYFRNLTNSIHATFGRSVTILRSADLSLTMFDIFSHFKLPFAIFGHCAFFLPITGRGGEGRGGRVRCKTTAGKSSNLWQRLLPFIHVTSWPEAWKWTWRRAEQSRTPQIISLLPIPRASTSKKQLHDVFICCRFSDWHQATLEQIKKNFSTAAFNFKCTGRKLGKEER